MRQTGRKRDMTRTQKARQETRLLSRARFPLGGREGGYPFGLEVQWSGSRRTMSKATAMTLILPLLPVAQVTGTAGIAGSQGPRPSAVHFTLDFPQSGTDAQPCSWWEILA